MRGPLAWVVAVVAGVVLVVIVTAMIGNRDKSGETVSAGQRRSTSAAPSASGVASSRRPSSRS